MIMQQFRFAKRRLVSSSHALQAMRVAPGEYLVVALTVLAASCRFQPVESVGNATLLKLPEVVVQQSDGRIWPGISLRPLFEIPADTSVMFYTPGAVRADGSGNIYVVDFGVLAIQQFDASGRFLASFGAGSGSGPGELSSILDMGVLGDSSVYIVDNAARKISYFGPAGDYIRSDFLKWLPVRYRVTSGGRSYMFLSQMDHLFETRLGDDVTRFGAVPDNPYGHGSGMALGMLTTFDESLIHVPVHFPVIVKYDPDGSVSYARGTPDWGKVDVPQWEQRILGGTTAYRVVSEVIHGDVNENGGRLFVHALLDSTGAIDVYRAATGDYLHSIRLPGNHYTYVADERVYQLVRATSTVIVYVMEGEGPH